MLQLVPAKTKLFPAGQQIPAIEAAGSCYMPTWNLLVLWLIALFFYYVALDVNGLTNESTWKLLVSYPIVLKVSGLIRDVTENQLVPWTVVKEV